MKHIKKLTKRGFVTLIALCMLLGSTLTAQADPSWGGSGPSVNINSTKYTIAINYIDDEGNELQTGENASLTGAGKTYTAAVPGITNYIYAGYYIEGDGSLTNLKTGVPTVTSKSDGSDSSGGKGSFTLNIVYSLDKNDNDIPDKEENFVITEKFEKSDGTTLQNDNMVYVNGAVEYNGVVPVIRGYKYVGYYYASTNIAHAQGSLTSPLTGNPYILMLSVNRFGSYVNHMVFDYDPDQWATISYDKNASEATGTMESHTGLIGDEVTLSTNRFVRPGYTFQGWSTSPNGSVEYGNENKVALTGNMKLYAIWEYDESQYATVTFAGNNDNVQGTMEGQKALKNSNITLNTNQFTVEDYLFLGWSTTADGTVEYTDKQVITLTENMTLYAVWGTAEIDWFVTADRSEAEVGDIIGYTLNLNNLNVLHSTTLYNTVATLTFDDEIEHENGSLVVTLNRKIVTVPYNYNDQVLTLNLGTIHPGDQYVITFNGVALASGEGAAGSVHFWLTGALSTNSRYTRSSLTQENTISMGGTGAAVTIVPAK